MLSLGPLPTQQCFPSSLAVVSSQSAQILTFSLLGRHSARTSRTSRTNTNTNNCRATPIMHSQKTPFTPFHRRFSMRQPLETPSCHTRRFSCQVQVTAHHQGIDSWELQCRLHLRPSLKQFCTRKRTQCQGVSRSHTKSPLPCCRPSILGMEVSQGAGA